jgi:hypothetical protein
MVRARRRRKGRSCQMHASSQRGSTNKRASGTLSLFPAAQGKGACIQVWLSRMLQGGRGVRAGQGRNVMFVRWLSICTRNPYNLHCHCFQTCFSVASYTEMILKARGRARVADMQIINRNISLQHYIFHSYLREQSNFSIHATHCNTERATLKYTR